MTRTTNHRKRLTRIARRNGVAVQHVQNWAGLADRLARHHGIPSPRAEAKRFCYQVMECRGWIVRRAPAISDEVMA